MKIIKYKMGVTVNAGTPEDPECATMLSAVEMPWSEANEAIAKAEAYNGEYTVEDDGQPDPEPTQAERIAELEEALELLLAGVTE